VNDSFGYDQANRLTSATVTNRGSGSYTYDPDGKRTSKTVSYVTTNYIWDVAGGLPRLLSDGTHRYVWGAQGLAYNVAISGGAVGTYHADQIGSIREITSGADGGVHTTYLTDEYGNHLRN
jgi:YD repeat-containing protein